MSSYFDVNTNTPFRSPDDYSCMNVSVKNEVFRTSLQAYEAWWVNDPARLASRSDDGGPSSPRTSYGSTVPPSTEKRSQSSVTSDDSSSSKSSYVGTYNISSDPWMQNQNEDLRNTEPARPPSPPKMGHEVLASAPSQIKMLHPRYRRSTPFTEDPHGKGKSSKSRFCFSSTEYILVARRRVIAKIQPSRKKDRLLPFLHLPLPSAPTSSALY